LGSHSRRALVISDGTDGLYPTPSPDSLRNRVHPLVRFTPLQSSPIPCLPRNLSAQSAFLGVAFPLRDISLRHRYGEVPPSPPSVHGVSHALDGFIRHRPCRFISPCSHVQGSTLQGFPLPAQPKRFVTASCPRVGWLRSPTNGCPLAPASVAPPSGLSSVPGVRCQRAGVTRRAARFPPGLSPPPGLPSPHGRRRLHALFHP